MKRVLVIVVLLAVGRRGLSQEVADVVAQSRSRGGLVVQVGCRDAQLLLAAAEAPNVLAQGLVSDPQQLDQVRDQIRAAGKYGQVTAVAWNGSSLPYADCMVNLLVVDDHTPLDAQEMQRVLAPLGVAWGVGTGSPALVRKPWPAEMDQWTHARYDSTGNAVSSDKGAGPPRYLQWEASPRWNRGVKTSGLVTVDGRIFYVLDDSHFATRTSGWSLVARDAFNGIELWRRRLPSWLGSQGGKKVGPAQVNRCLVATAQHVFIPLGDRAPVSVLDPINGEVIRTLDESAGAEELLVSRGTLVVLVNPNTPAGLRRGAGPQNLRLQAYDPDTGRLLWEHTTKRVLPLTMAADVDQVVFHDGTAVQSLDLQSGKKRWSSAPTGQKLEHRDQANADSPGATDSTIVLAPQFAPTLILYDDVVAFAGGKQLNVLSARDGQELWRSEYAPSNYSVPVDLFGFSGYLWGPDMGMNLWRPLDDNLDVNAYNRQTGNIERHVSGHYGYRFQHHRCHQMKVVDNQVVAGRAGIEFLDTSTGEVVANHWTRGSCYYGVLPANGRLYVPPHDCACYVRAKLAGFFSLNAQPPSRSGEITAEQRLQPGPAYGQTADQSGAASDQDWPTYRHDMARSGRTNGTVGTQLLLGWTHALGGRLTSPVIAGNQVYVASIDTHQLFALDAGTGEVQWEYACDGRIDAPPTIHEGLVLVGCRDGSVHAVRATDGTRVWRFLAQPQQRVIVSHGQLESVWPVHGSVLVLNDLAYFVAGRSTYLDDGLHVYGLDPHTGQQVVHRVLSSRHADGSELLDEEGVDGCLNDVLSTNGKQLFLRHQPLDLQGNPLRERIAHLHSPDGLLSSDTTSRLLWTYAPMYTSPHQGAFYDLRLSRMLFPSGRILVEDQETIYGYGQNRYDQPVAETGGQWALFAAEKKSPVPLDLTAREYRAWALANKPTVQFRWWTQLPIQVRAMAQANDTLFVAGPMGGALTSRAALDGNGPAQLLAVSLDSGELLATMALPSTPCWDAMAVAHGNLYVSLSDGQLLSLWAADTGRPGKPLSPEAWQTALPELQLEPEPGLVGHWRFDEGRGLLARDCSGKGHHANVLGNWSDDPEHVCLVSDSTPQAAVIPDSDDFHFGNGDFTLALWIQVTAHGVRLVGKEAFPENWWVINLTDAGQAELVLGEGRGAGKTVRTKTDTALALNAWNHLAAVVDRQAGTVQMYLNGTPSGRQSIPTTMNAGIHATGREISIPSRHLPFRGRIGDFRIYRQALSAERIQQLHAQSPTEARK